MCHQWTSWHEITQQFRSAKAGPESKNSLRVKFRVRIYSKPKKGSRQRSWYIDYRDLETGRRVRRVCGSTRREAETYRARIEGELFSGTRAASSPENPPCYEYLQQCVEHLGATGISSSSLRRYRQIAQNFMDFLGTEMGITKAIITTVSPNGSTMRHCDGRPSGDLAGKRLIEGEKDYLEVNISGLDGRRGSQGLVNF